MTRKLKEIMSEGYRAEIHVIGDRAVDITLDGLVKSGFSTEQIRGFRHVLNLGSDTIGGLTFSKGKI